MIFFFKKKTVYLDCYTCSDVAYHYNKIDRAIKFMPKWWKDLPREYFGDFNSPNIAPQSTMKRCEGLISFYREGFILPLWTDLILVTSPEKDSFRWQAADQKTSLDLHDEKQYQGLINSNEYMQIKLHSPWMITCDEAINFSVCQPSYNWKDFTNIHVVPGIFDFKYQFSTNINFLIRKDYKRIQLDAGQPLLWLGPMTERNIELRHHLISQEEFNKNILRGAHSYTFTQRYKTNKEKGICPMELK